MGAVEEYASLHLLLWEREPHPKSPPSSKLCNTDPREVPTTTFVGQVPVGNVGRPGSIVLAEWAKGVRGHSLLVLPLHSCLHTLNTLSTWSPQAAFFPLGVKPTLVAQALCHQNEPLVLSPVCFLPHLASEDDTVSDQKVGELEDSSEDPMETHSLYVGDP